MSTTPFHIAGFSSSDPDSLVEASLACQICLRTPVLVLVVDGEDPRAFAHCPVCATPTEVLLTTAQAGRLVLAPPTGPSVQLVS